MSLSQTSHQAHLALDVEPPDVEQLEFLADWKADLQTRIRRALLRFELVDFDHDFADLEEEVADFVRVCRALMWRRPAC
jgi:hypothetical protein